MNNKIIVLFLLLGAACTTACSKGGGADTPPPVNPPAETPPAITAIAPDNGVYNTVVNITGSNFSMARPPRPDSMAQEVSCSMPRATSSWWRTGAIPCARSRRQGS